MSKETARRGRAASGRRDSRAGADAAANGRDTGQLTSGLDEPAGDVPRRADLTAPLFDNGDPAQTLVLAGIGMPDASSITAELEHRTHKRNRRLLILGIVTASLFLLLVTFSMSPLTDPVAGSPPRTPYPIALAEVQPYGVNTFLHKEVDTWKKEKTLTLARDMGAGWIKQQFPWAEIEFRENPNDPFWDVKHNQSAWDKFDRMVNLAEQNGLRVIARIDSVPVWARPTDPALLQKFAQEGMDPAKAPPIGPHLDDFSAFIDTFVKRYKGRVAAIQVWNEPNLKGEWATGNPVNPAEYSELLKAAYTAAKAADPNIIVLAAPLATNNETLAYAGNLNEVDYLQGMYDAGASPYFDAMAANAYGTIYPPDDPPSQSRLNFRRVELLRGVMEKNGDDKKAVWFNEYGWNASPADMPQEKLRWGRVNDAQQGEYIVGGIQYAREHWPWAGVFTIWYLRQVGDIPRTDSEYFFGLVNPEFVVSSAYKTIQESASDARAATPGEWGPLSPPIAASSRWQLRLAQSPESPGLYIVPTASGDTLTIPFTGTDLHLRLVPVSAGAAITGTLSARYYVTVDGGQEKVSPLLPRDKGRAYIDRLGDVTVASGLGEQFPMTRHVARIQVEAPPVEGEISTQGSSGGGSRLYSLTQQSLEMPGISAVVVEARRSYVLFGVFSLSLLAVMGGLLWMLRK